MLDRDIFLFNITTFENDYHLYKTFEISLIHFRFRIAFQESLLFAYNYN